MLSSVLPDRRHGLGPESPRPVESVFNSTKGVARIFADQGEVVQGDCCRVAGVKCAVDTEEDRNLHGGVGSRESGQDYIPIEESDSPARFLLDFNLMLRRCLEVRAVPNPAVKQFLFVPPVNHHL